MKFLPVVLSLAIASVLGEGAASAAEVTPDAAALGPERLDLRTRNKQTFSVDGRRTVRVSLAPVN